MAQVLRIRLFGQTARTIETTKVNGIVGHRSIGSILIVHSICPMESILIPQKKKTTIEVISSVEISSQFSLCILDNKRPSAPPPPPATSPSHQRQRFVNDF